MAPADGRTIFPAERQFAATDSEMREPWAERRSALPTLAASLKLNYSASLRVVYTFYEVVNTLNRQPATVRDAEYTSLAGFHRCLHRG
jgi:hypothetical protein